jgi:hypothetical protein
MMPPAALISRTAKISSALSAPSRMNTPSLITSPPPLPPESPAQPPLSIHANPTTDAAANRLVSLAMMIPRARIKTPATP